MAELIVITLPIRFTPKNGSNHYLLWLVWGQAWNVSEHRDLEKMMDRKFNASLLRNPNLFSLQTEYRGEKCELLCQKWHLFVRSSVEMTTEKSISSVKGKKRPMPVPLSNWNRQQLLKNESWRFYQLTVWSNSNSGTDTPIHWNTFDQNPLPASLVVRERARFEAVWSVHRYELEYAEWGPPQWGTQRSLTRHRIEDRPEDRFHRSLQSASPKGKR